MAGQSLPCSSINLSGTIAASGTFQQIQAQNLGRIAGAINNNGANQQWVFFGPIANATTLNSWPLNVGGWVNCQAGPVYTISDQVSIAGTAGDTFFANFQ